MRLPLHTDFALRLLIYLEVRGDVLVTTAEVAQAYGISRHDLAKVVQDLTALSYVESVRGGKGGIRLAETAERINIGAVVRHFISSSVLIECFDEETNTCPISPGLPLEEGSTRCRGGFPESPRRVLLVRHCTEPAAPRHTVALGLSPSRRAAPGRLGRCERRSRVTDS